MRIVQNIDCVFPGVITPVPDLRFEDRAKRLAFKLTSRFEGGSPSSIQTIDSGIVSYGRHQASLASGALEKVLKEYLKGSLSGPALRLRSYIPKVELKDPALRHDKNFLTLLRQAGSEPAMEAAQETVFSENYWEPAKTLAKKTGLTSEIGYAVFYDTKVQGGLEIVLKRTLNRQRGACYNERRFLENFLNERRNYILEVAKRKRASGDINSAKFLESSAFKRINSLKLELNNYSFD